MSKLNKVIYKKLSLQAEEAKDQGLTKLASAVFDAIGEPCDNAEREYSYGQLQSDIHKDLWKLATRLMVYYDIESADVAKVDDVLLSFASKIVDDLEVSFGVDPTAIGALEPKVFGETK